MVAPYVIVKGQHGSHHPIYVDNEEMAHKAVVPLSTLLNDMLPGEVPVSGGVFVALDTRDSHTVSCLNDLWLSMHEDDLDILTRHFLKDLKAKLPPFDREAVFAEVDASNRRMSAKRKDKFIKDRKLRTPDKTEKAYDRAVTKIRSKMTAPP